MPGMMQRPPRNANDSSPSAATPAAANVAPSAVPSWDTLPVEPVQQPAAEPPPAGNPGPDTATASPAAVEPAPSGDECPATCPARRPTRRPRRRTRRRDEMTEGMPDEVTDEVLADRPEPAVQPAGAVAAERADRRPAAGCPKDAQRDLRRRTEGIEVFGRKATSGAEVSPVGRRDDRRSEHEVRTAREGLRVGHRGGRRPDGLPSGRRVGADLSARGVAEERGDPGRSLADAPFVGRQPRHRRTG